MVEKVSVVLKTITPMSFFCKPLKKSNIASLSFRSIPHALSLLFILSAVLPNVLNAGTPGFVNPKNVFGTRCFVENRGQFDRELPGEAKILFAYQQGEEQIFFTERGLEYKFAKIDAFTERDRETIEKGKHFEMPVPELHYAKMNWLGANADIKVESDGQLSHYFSYGPKELNALTFSKIIYKNVYDKIDIEYTLPVNNEHGIKYNIILHPGADPSQIKISYSGEINRIRKTDEGDIIIKTDGDDITEHAPQTTYASGEKIASEFILEEDVISFSFPQGYDARQEVIVDPWVTTILSLGTNNYAYDVDYDFFGNTFIYGGYSPFKVAMYNSSGVLVWTFMGTVASPAWSSAPITSQASNFAVNKYNSKTYIGQGYVGSGNKVIRLDNAGNYDNFVNTANNQFQEVWDMGFHCVTGEVFVLGGGTSSNISAVTIDPVNANIVLSTFQPTNSNIAQDVVSHAIDDNGVIFVIYAGGNMSNKICRVNSTFNGNLWTLLSGFTVFTEQGNKNQYQWGGTLSSNGFNCLAVNANYLYYYDGLNLAAYNKTTGAQVAAVVVPGLTLKRQGGIAVDDCDNLYLGGQSNILRYNFNGTTFSTLTPMPLGVSTPTQAVYDLKLDKINKLLYTSGSGFVGVYTPSTTMSCPTATSACFVFVPTDFVICAGESATIVASNSSSLTNTSFSIQPGGQTNTTGSFVVSPTVTTNYTTFTTGTNLGNVVMTNSAISHVTVYAQPSTAPTTTQSTCTNTTNAFNLGLTFFPASPVPSYTVSWSPAFPGLTATTTSGTNLPPGVYTATVQTSGACMSIATFTIDPPPEQSTFTMTTLNGYLINCYQPVLTVSYMPAGYNYTTTNGAFAAQNGNTSVFTSTGSAGNWTVTGANPVSGCVSTQTFAIVQNTVVPTATVAPLLQAITCSLGSVQTVTATGNPTSNATCMWMSPQGGTLLTYVYPYTYQPGTPGTYTQCLLNQVNGCSTCNTFTVTSNDGFPTFSVTSPQSFTLGCSTKSIATINIVNANTTPPGGSVSYTIIGPPTSTSYVPGSQAVYTVNVPGTWTVITKDILNNCESKIQVSVLQNTFAPDITVTTPVNFLTCETPSAVLAGSTTFTNVNYNWSFAGTPGNQPGANLTTTANFSAPTQTLNGNYTLSITNNDNLCITRSVVTMGQNLFPPKPVISGLNAISCKTSTLMLTNQSTTGIPPSLNPTKAVVAKEWRGPSPQDPMYLVSSYVAYMPGTFTMITVDLNNGCSAIGTKTIDDFRDYPPIKTPAAPDTALNCGATSMDISPRLDANSAYSYSWVAAPNATVSQLDKRVLSVNSTGQYWITVTNTLNGCASSGYINVLGDTLVAGFTPDVVFGFAPMEVRFTNTSHSKINTGNVKTIWSFGNGTEQTTLSQTISPQTIYTQPGKFTITIYASKGECQDSARHIIEVEIPSSIEVPNVFSPNGDGVNDLFFLKADNLVDIYMIIYDRWGHKVYELQSGTGNVAWDGKNQIGKEVSEGVYQYVLKYTGKDGATGDLHGNITLVR